MRTSQFAKLRVVVPRNTYDGKNGSTVGAELVTVGLAQSLRIEDNFGTKAENVIGTPFPVFHPGFQQTTITIEKATVDGYSFRNLGAFNPLWAHVGSTYNMDSGLITLKTGSTDLVDIIPENSDTQIMPFMFILAVYDDVSDSYYQSNFPDIGVTADKENRGGQKKGISHIGSYCCVLNSANTTLSSSNAIIMDNVTCFARPIAGTWFNDAISKAYREQNGNNGLDHFISSVLFGYFSEKPWKESGAK